MNSLQHASASTGAGASAAVVLAWILKVTLGVDTPPDVLVAEGVLLTWAAGYFFHNQQAEETK